MPHNASRLRLLVTAARLLLWRVLLSGAGSGLLVGLASLGLLLTTEGRALNLIFEPFSLLFLPGIVVAMGWTILGGHLHKHPKTFAENHDFSPALVVQCSLLFYFAILYWLQSRRRRAAAKTAEAGSG